MRHCETASSPYRMMDICEQIPLTLDDLPLDTIGYHQNCYKSFTGKIDHLQVSKASTSGESSSLKKDSLRDVKSLSIQSEGAPRRCFPISAFSVTKQNPSSKERLKSLQSFRVGNTRNQPGKLLNLGHNIAHNKSYCVVKDYILRNVIECKEVVQLRSMCNLYMKTLENQGFPNPEYRSEKLARRLQEDKVISHEFTFSKVQHRGCIESNLIYSSSITVDEAVGCAYKLGTADQLQEAALTLHSHIIKAFKESKELPWPPTAQELDAVKMDVLLSEHLVQFLSSVVTGTLDSEKCEKTQRLVYSIAQDVCRTATNSKWKLPKHILLCATLRHLYRSKQVSYKLIYCLQGPTLSMLNFF